MYLTIGLDGQGYHSRRVGRNEGQTCGRGGCQGFGAAIDGWLIAPIELAAGHRPANGVRGWGGDVIGRKMLYFNDLDLFLRGRGHRAGHVRIRIKLN